MENKNPIDFVKLLYVFNPNFSDGIILYLTTQMFRAKDWMAFPEPLYSKKTLSVWKARLRKKGVHIPDQRKKKENKE